MTREVKLFGFAILLAAIFVCAHTAGSHLGPVSTNHSQVSYPGMGNMNGVMHMGRPTDEGPAPAPRLRGAGR